MTKETLEKANLITNKLNAAQEILSVAKGDNYFSISAHSQQSLNSLGIHFSNDMDKEIYHDIINALEKYIERLKDEFKKL